ncbi:MAG: TIGR03557 family F420-dependent LLM class oxidoreductase [Pseudonocardiaceae bacterium]
MVSVGYALSCEEFGPHELVRLARLAEEAGFERLWISDHYHPWLREQGQSPFVWSVIGALSQVSTLPISTGVTCPIIRMHPAIIAQAAATAAVQCEGRFALGVGTGEALNEHILGDRWPPPGVRRGMLREAVAVIRALHAGGEVTHYGKYYTVENAEIFTRPEQPVPIYVSGFGPAAARLAGEIGDGFCCAMPGRELVRTFRDSGGGDKPAQVGIKVCWADTESKGVTTAHRLWRNVGLPGVAQTLPAPRDFTAVCELVTEDMVARSVACGPDPHRYLDLVRQHIDAGFDEIYVQQIGPDQESFFEGWANEVLPRLR